MSTKTSIKRIALVAVSALGLGVLTSVAPASAASTLGDVYFGTTGTTTSSVSTAVGTATTGTAATVTVSHTSDTTPSAVTLTPTLVKPTNSSADVSSTYLNYTLSAGTNQTAAGQVPNTSTGAIVATSTAAAATATVFSPVVNFTPDVPGIYTLTFALTGAGAAGGGRSLSAVLTIYAGYSADALHANKAFPTQGANITTGWNGIAGGQATIRFTGFATSKTYYVTTDTGSILSYTERDSGSNLGSYANTNGTNLAGGFNFATGGSTISSDALDVTVTDLGAASTTVTVKSFDATTGASTTFAAATVTWGAAAKVSAQYSLVKLLAGAVSTDVTAATTDTTATSVSKASGTQRFTIEVEINDQNNAVLNGQTLTATITGPGLIGIADARNATTATGRSLTQALTNNYGSVSVWGDGSAGEATITITAGNTTQGFVTLATKTVTFVGSAVKAVATQNLYVAKAGTQLGATPSTTDGTNDGSTMALTPAFTVEVMDAAGNDVVAGSTVKMVSSDTSVITVGTCAENSTYSGNFECSVSGAVGAASGSSATVTFSVYNSTTAAYDIIAAPLTFKVGGAIESVTVTLDKASYTPGEAMVLKATAVDSKGNSAYDGQAPYQTISSNKTVGGALPATTKYIKNGYYATSATSPTLYAPAVSGDFIVKGLTIATVAAPLGAAYSVTGTVVDENQTAATDAANEATDAANAATDAANAAAEAADAATAAAQDAQAAVAALATSVSSLIAGIKAQITSLTNLVIKIQKKVKA